jgi:hypothetical protein
MLPLGLGLLMVGLGLLFAMVIQLLPSILWLALLAYAMAFSGLFMAVLQIAARFRR